MNEKITQFIGKTKLFLAEKKPDILLGIGVGTHIASVAYIIKGTRQIDDILDFSKKEFDEIHNANLEPAEERKMLFKAYIDFAVKLLKIYYPAIIFEAVTVACIASAIGDLKQKNAKLAAALSSLGAMYNAYVARVKEEVGPEKEREIRLECDQKTIEIDENGEVIKTKRPEMSKCDPCSKLYADYTSSEYKRNNPVANMDFINQTRRFANMKLRSNGYLFLNEVYYALGLQPTLEGQFWGWVVDDRLSPDSQIVNFGIEDKTMPRVLAFMDGDEDAIWLEFNAYPIVDLLKGKLEER